MKRISKSALLLTIALGFSWVFTGAALADREATHRQIVQQFGGTVSDQKLTGYVDRVGQTLARVSDMPKVKYRFTVLDSPMVNAFALPEGDIYVTRGLLSLANSEAELAGVLGHEIAHVTDSHSSGRQTRAIGLTILSAVLGIATESKAVADLTQMLGSGYIASYSRDQEFDADKLGIKFIRRAGYYPRGQGDFLYSLQRETELAKKKAGVTGRGDPYGGFFASHPNTADRVERAHNQAKKAEKRLLEAGVKSPRQARNEYLSAIDGLVFGDSAEQGFVEGQRFSHPKLRLTFEVPAGFQLQNQADAVVAGGPNGNNIRFDMVQRSNYNKPTDYIRNEWGKKLNLIKLGDTRVNGMDTAVGVARVSKSNKSTLYRLVALRGDQGQYYRFVFADPQESNHKVMSETVSSFRRLSKKEASKLRPKRIQVVQVKNNRSHEYFAKQMRVDKVPLDLFRVLNGLQPGQALAKGQRVKIVAQ